MFFLLYFPCNFYLLLCCSHIDFVTLSLPPRCRQYCCSLFPPKVAHTSPDRRTKAESRETRTGGGPVNLLLVFISSVSSLHGFYFLYFFSPFLSVSFQYNQGSLPSVLLWAGVGVFLSPWPPAQLRVISGIDQGVLSLTAALPFPLCQVCQQQPFSWTGAHCFRLQVAWRSTCSPKIRTLRQKNPM